MECCLLFPIGSSKSRILLDIDFIRFVFEIEKSLFEGMDFQGNIVRGRVEGLTPYKNILNPLFDKLADKSVDRVIVVGGGAKSPKIQVYSL